MALHEYFELAARQHADHIAVEEPGVGKITYAELAALTDTLRDRLIHLGVKPGDRVGVYLRKSIDSVAAILGILKSGAAYVPVDPGAPAARNAYIFGNCAVRAAIVQDRFAPELMKEMETAGAAVPRFLVVPGAGGGGPLRACLDREESETPAPRAPTVVPSPDELAYILYTSGSTGKPKGVMLSHRNATSFVDWCSSTFEPVDSDRFSSHAPFHFDLSILDIYTPLKHGATLVLVAEELGKNPGQLAALIAEARLTVWYSVPSILSLLAQFGNLPSRDYSSLRTVLFAGEVFPVAQLRVLKKLWPQPRYFNLYGPTETNVCTYYEIPREIPEDRSTPFPIGPVCSHLQSLVVDGNGKEVTRGEEGELCISGPAVTSGYWALPELTGRAFLPPGGGASWYRTGDLVVEEADGCYRFLGRKDRMVKKRGYRVELGEIEACLYRHAEVREAAVVAVSDTDGGVAIRAHLTTRGDKRLSLIELKSFCSSHLPMYMVPDRFCFHPTLPKTSTDKIDYQSLLKWTPA